MASGERTALVIGGAGRLGKYVVKHLKQDGWNVRVLDVQPYTDDVGVGAGVDVRFGSLLDESKLREVMENVQCVLHLAGIIDIHPLPSPKLHQINVDGTALIIKVCRDMGVRSLVYTSTFDVIFDGEQPFCGGVADLPALKVLTSHYAQTKSDAERLVLDANGNDLATCSLRPGHIYGPEDIMITNVVVNGKFRAPVRMSPPKGQPQAKMSFVNLDNTAHAHVLAANLLQPNSPIAGESFIITEGSEINVFDYLEEVCKGLVTTPTIRISPMVMFSIACVVEWIAVLFILIGLSPPPFNRFVLASVTTNCYANFDKAKRLLGYKPIKSFDEAFKETRHWFEGYVVSKSQ